MTHPSARARRATRADVARRAGVAPSTVSIVLNGRAEQVQLSAATADRVRQAAADLNYVPSAVGRALKRNSSRMLGLMLGQVPPRATMPIFQDPVIAAITRSRAAGYLLLPVPESEDADQSAYDGFAAITGVDIAGVVCETTAHNIAIGERLVRTGIPVVWMSSMARSSWPDGLGAVYIDEEDGSTELANALFEAGHRRVGLIGNTVDGPRFDPFLRIFGDGCVRIPTDYWVEADGQAAFGELQRHSPLPTAVACANDLLAIGVIQAAISTGLRVPDDIAVAGFGDFDLSADVSPALTTVTWPLRTMTNKAIEMLIDVIEHPNAEVDQTPVRLPTSAVARASTDVTIS